MSLTGEQIQELLDAGIQAEHLPVIAKVFAKAKEREEKSKSEKRERDKIRQAEYRAKNKLSQVVTVTTCDIVRHDVTSCDNPPQGSLPPDGFPPNPLSLTPNSPNSPPKENPLKGVKEKSPKITLETVGVEHIGQEWLDKHNFSPGLDLAEELEKFRDHYRANGGKQSNGNLINDWPATLRNWLRKKENGSSKFVTSVGKPAAANYAAPASSPRESAWIAEGERLAVMYEQLAAKEARKSAAIDTG